jgi:hypothetical protein
MALIDKDGFYSVVFLIVGIPLTVIGLGVSGVILFSGLWGLAHAFPILIFSIPISILWVRVTKSGYRRLKRIGTHN